MSLKYLEDFSVGQIIELGQCHLTREDSLRFAREFDPQPFHIDEAAANASIFGGLIASGWHTCSLMMRLLVDNLLSNTASMGSPGVDELRWLLPVRPGDTLTAQAVVNTVKPSSSKPDRGVVNMSYEVFNQNGEKVLTMKAMSMLKTRSKSD